MQVQTYLTFNGRCEEAIEFYRRAVGAELDMLLRFRESPEPIPATMLPPGHEDKVMHASFRIGQTVVMADDGGCCSFGGPGYRGFAGFSLSIALSDEASADRCFNALVEGGQVRMPLGKTFWSPRFGMQVDRFGVAWMINVVPG